MCGDSFHVIAETDTKNSEQLTFCYIKDNCDHQSNQDGPGTDTINPQSFTVDEQDVTPPLSPTNNISHSMTSNGNTPSPQNKNNLSFEDHQQFIYRINAQMSVLKSHMKCELPTIRSKTDSLSDIVETKISNLNDRQKNL